MSPLHHHYQKKNIHEAKIVTRFWIVGILLAIINTGNIKIKMSERVAILGAGESGTGAALLAKVKGFDVFVSDQAQIKEKYQIELTKENIAFEEGIHTDEQILNAQLVIKSPGIPDKAEIIKKVKAAGIPIIDEIEFASRYTNGKIIAITGTNGKTTTTLAHISFDERMRASMSRWPVTSDSAWHDRWLKEQHRLVCAGDQQLSTGWNEDIQT